MIGAAVLLVAEGRFDWLKFAVAAAVLAGVMGVAHCVVAMAAGLSIAGRAIRA